jgi:hypothetical protein
MINLFNGQFKIINKFFFFEYLLMLKEKINALINSFNKNMNIIQSMYFNNNNIF